MKINYRPEIDVLRALSVISVIIYHSNIKIHGLTLFSGGYLCDKNIKVCHGMSKDGLKLFYDKYHITIEGAKFFGKIIDESNLLNLN